MRWVTYRADGRTDRVGVLAGDRIHALPPGTTLLGLLESGPDALREAGEHARANPHATAALGEVTLRAPIPRPPSIRDCLCFLDHMRNINRGIYGDGELKDVWYEIPAFYFASPGTVTGPHDDVPIFPGSQWFDFELEVAAVLGSGGRDLDPEEAEERIAGYTLMCDWSARDLQLAEAPLGIGQAKGKDGATTLGPYFVTADELEPYRRGGRLAMELAATVDGELIGGGRLDAMDWTFGEVVSYASRGVDLVPGEVFGSGTVPGGCLVEHLDMGRPEDFRGWLAAGNVVSLSGEGLGETRQVVRPAPPVHPLAPRPR